MNMNWLSRLRMLHHLDLSGVDLSKAINWLQVISTFSSLTELHLSNCWLLHISPHVSTLNITSLSLLDLSLNNFNSSFPQWVFSITSLVSLDLTQYHFHGPVPRSNTDSIGNLTSLQLLYMAGNDFMNSSSVLKGFSSVASNLISLDVSSCGILSSVLDSLHNLTSLVSLDLSNNQLTKTIPKSLCNFCNLRYVVFSYNDFLNISLTYLLQRIFKCKTSVLESLDLSSLGLSGQLRVKLKKWHNWSTCTFSITAFLVQFQIP
ncbi:hypothetical protein CTI12_AA480500 [Artemisia annua]|uniref:Leucine-rich repeat protein n=1 Tax=Artemisia annua TaxID=35608 RepID=A0A2U1LLU9_ARTAN|nr:hypothetical protein CTI12_AA480500 [Artemisia annua]